MSQPSSTDAAKLDAVRGVLSAFDWERDDRQYALEEIERTVSEGDAAPVSIVSFGYGHGAPPEAHATFDVRRHFKDPHVRPELRDLTGDSPAVVAAVMSTAGVERLVCAITATARAFLDGPQSGPVTIAVGCVGGRHRSAVIADQTASRLRGLGVAATATHRDKHRPVIARPAVPAANGWQDNKTTERLARKHNQARKGATAAEIVGVQVPDDQRQGTPVTARTYTRPGEVA
jgi:P-loop ATPase protein family